MQVYTKTSESHAETSNRPPKGFWQGYKPKAPSATCKRLGARSAAVFEAIFGLFNVPAKFHRLLLFLYAFGQGESEYETYIGEMANAYYDEERGENRNWKRAASAREQRFGAELAELRDWQDLRSSQLAVYFPGDKIEGRSRRGKILLPMADLFARIYSESKSTSAFQHVRDAKLKQVAEQVIAEFHSLAPPSRRRPRSLTRNDRIERQIACLLTKARRLTPELLEDENARLWTGLDQIRAERNCLPVINTEEIAVDSPEQITHFDMFSCKPTLDSIEDSGNLGAEVDSEIREENEPQNPPPCDSYFQTADLGKTTKPNENESQGGATLLALEAFESVNSPAELIIFKNDETKEAESTQRMTSDEFRAALPDLIEDARQGGVSLIVRVGGIVQQIGDLNDEALELLRPYAFIGYPTSPGNSQVWLAFKQPEDRDCRYRLLARVKEVCPEANFEANGATRWPGSINFKPGRDQWRIGLTFTNPGRFVSPADLEDAGLLADPAPGAQWEYDPDGTPGTWPDYDRCVEDTTLNGVCDRSRADWRFVCYALKRWNKPKDIAEKLLEVSERAKESGAKYVNRTIAKAVDHLGLEPL